MSRTFRSVFLVARVYFRRSPETSEGFWRWPNGSVQNWFDFCIITEIVIVSGWTLDYFCCLWWYTAFRMGSHLVRSYITERDTTPDPRKPSAYDPQLGFPERKERGNTTLLTEHLIRAFQTSFVTFRFAYVSKHESWVLCPSDWLWTSGPVQRLQQKHGPKCVCLGLCVLR